MNMITDTHTTFVNWAGEVEKVRYFDSNLMTAGQYLTEGIGEPIAMCGADIQLLRVSGHEVQAVAIKQTKGVAC